jgi:hypothetical protein
MLGRGVEEGETNYDSERPRFIHEVIDNIAKFRFWRESIA